MRNNRVHLDMKYKSNPSKSTESLSYKTSSLERAKQITANLNNNNCVKNAIYKDNQGNEPIII